MRSPEPRAWASRMPSRIGIADRGASWYRWRDPGLPQLFGDIAEVIAHVVRYVEVDGVRPFHGVASGTVIMA